MMRLGRDRHSPQLLWPFLVSLAVFLVPWCCALVTGALFLVTAMTLRDALLVDKERSTRERAKRGCRARRIWRADTNADECRVVTRARQVGPSRSSILLDTELSYQAFAVGLSFFPTKAVSGLSSPRSVLAR